jgi:hypothetical protein
MKGVGRTGPYTYDHAEIWATPYSTNPSDLNPELVGGYAYTAMGPLVGGWGRLATVEGVAGGTQKNVAIWSIATKSAKRYALPEDHFPNVLMGVTRTHFLLGAEKPSKATDSFLMRFNVE